MKIRGLALLGVALLWPWAAADRAFAAASPWVGTEQTKVRLIAAVDAVGSGDSVLLGLHFRLRPGWKIYWRSPGDAGFPPRPDWSGSTNLAAARLFWPAPERFSVVGFETLGYQDEVVLPVAVTLARAGQPLGLRAAVDYLTCKEICVPYTADLALDLPAGTAGLSRHAHLINRSSARVPGDGTAHGLSIGAAEVAGAGPAAVLTVSATATMPFETPDVFVEGPPELTFGRPRVRLSADRMEASLEVAVDGMEDFDGDLAGSRVTVTVVDGGRAVERTIAVAAGGAPTVPGGSLAWILVLALLGGLILNLMPCVLPVLSIKLLGVVGHGGGERRTVRISFLASAAGILFAFVLLAAVLAGLKAAGATIGWGIQFQHPWFLIAMTLVVALFACNLWGFFEVRLPRWIAAAGGPVGHLHGLGGHFLSGVFATLLATPCSAPFLGTAVGFALARGKADIFAVFAVLGLGLALPYLAVAAAPGLATRLPRPGRWMTGLRVFLGFALAATAGWLLSVLATVAGVTAAAVVGILTVIAGGALYWRRRSDRPVAAPAAAVLAILAFGVPYVLPMAPAPAGTVVRDSLWQRFDEADIAKLVNAGKTVFVDVTAEWCITCQANKTFVLYRDEVLQRLSGGSVVAMRADWTRPDDAIARYLARFGRYGIPFNAVYGPGAPGGIVLPELLSRNAVLDALDRAGAGTVSARE